MKVLKWIGIAALCAAVFVFVQAFIATSLNSASKQGETTENSNTATSASTLGRIKTPSGVKLTAEQMPRNFMPRKYNNRKLLKSEHNYR